jgi:hypothetical protein
MFIVNNNQQPARARRQQTETPAPRRQSFPRVVSDKRTKRDYFKTTVALGCFVVALVSIACTLFFVQNQGGLRGRAIAATEQIQQQQAADKSTGILTGSVADVDAQLARAREIAAALTAGMTVNAPESRRSPLPVVVEAPPQAEAPLAPAVEVQAPRVEADGSRVASAPIKPFESSTHLKSVANPFPGRPDGGLVVVTFTDFSPAADAQPNSGANTVTGGANDGATQAAILRSWARNAKAAGMNCLIMMCTPSPPSEAETADLATECAVAHAPACAVNPRLSRWFYVKNWLSDGYDVLSTDPDVAFLRSPLPHLARLARAHPEADVFTGSDSNTGVYVYGAPLRSGGAEKSPDGKRGWSVLRAPGERGAMPPTRWDASFPNVKIKQGFVFRPEHAHRDVFALPDLVTLLDTGDAELGLDGPDNCWPHAFNTGFMVWRATQRAQTLMARWVKELIALKSQKVADDQVPFNNAAKNGSTHCARHGREFIPANLATVCGGDQLLNGVAGGTACLGILALAQFGNGFTFSTARDWEQYRVKPYALHATYSGDKVMKLREEGVMIDNSDHYKGRFLVYEPDITQEFFAPRADVEDAPATFYTWKRHWLLMQHQLVQFRAAASLAMALNRTLVLPRMAAGCECFFYPGKDCVIDGHRVRLPHVMPTDHWLRPRRLKLPHREPGFVDNPRFQNGDVKTLEPCVTDEACGAHAGGARVPARSSDAFVRRELGAHIDATLVRVVKPLEVFGAFEREEDARALANALDGVVGAFCCIKNEDQARWPGVEVLQVPYAFEGPPAPIDNGAPDAARCGI